MIKNFKCIAVFLCIIFPIYILYSYSNSKKIPMGDSPALPMQLMDKPGINIKLPNTARRLHLDEIELSAELTKKQILVDWGSPDAVEGFGVEYWVYKLEDGCLLWLLFASQAPQPLLKAVLFINSSDTEGKTLFDGMNETKLR